MTGADPGPFDADMGLRDADPAPPDADLGPLDADLGPLDADPGPTDVTTAEPAPSGGRNPDTAKSGVIAAERAPSGVTTTDPAPSDERNPAPSQSGEPLPMRGSASGPATSSVHLIGGGWNLDHLAAVYGGFLDDAAAVAARVGRPGKPVIACVVLDEGDGRQQFARWDNALRAVANCEPVPVLITVEAPLDVSDVGNADGLLVCGGLTPAYARAMAAAATGILDWLLLGDRPYAGFSAGSAVAAAPALVGGWVSDGVPICPDDAAEELEELAVAPGLGLVPFLVDVHCTQWGTLPRLITAVAAEPGACGAGIDENTVLIVAPDGRAGRVRGAGQVWWVCRTADGSVAVTPHRDGDEFALH